MLKQSFYSSVSISHLYEDSLYKNQSMIRQIIQVQNQRDLIWSVIHMLLGQSSSTFQFQSNQFKYCGKIQMTHLCQKTLRQSLEPYLQLANKLAYLRIESARYYDAKNGVLTSFVQGVYIFMNRITQSLTNHLRHLQEESGNIIRNKESFEQSKHNKITLATLWQSLSEINRAANLVVGIFKACTLPDNYTVQEVWLTIVLLLNQYYLKCDEEYLQGQGCDLEYSVHVLFSLMIKNYMQSMQCLLIMNENKIQMRASSGFFINLSLICRRQKLDSSEEDKLEHFFQFQQLLHEERIPLLFKSSYQQILSLSKTIQFILLYYQEEEKEKIYQFLGIQKSFENLYGYLDQICRDGTISHHFFERKHKNNVTISRRLGNLKPSEMRLNKLFRSNNPFYMNSETQGVFNISLSYSENSQPNKKIQKSNYQQKYELSNLSNVNHSIMMIMSQILTQVNQKCLLFFQQKQNQSISSVLKIVELNRIRRSIYNTLSGIKKFMLFEQGDFIQELLEMICPLLERSVDKISRNLLSMHIEECLKIYITKVNDDLRDCVSFQFLRSENKQQALLKGWRLFSLYFRPPKPVNSIFTKKVMKAYANVSNLLFNLKRCEYLSVSVWREWQNRKNSTEKLLKLRHTIHHFTSALLSHLLFEINLMWEQFLKNIESCDHLLQIIDLNQQVLLKMSELTFENEPLCNCLTYLIKIVDRLVVMTGHDQQDKEEIVLMWNWMGNIKDQSKRIKNFNQMIDFNLQRI